VNDPSLGKRHDRRDHFPEKCEELRDLGRGRWRDSGGPVVEGLGRFRGLCPR
jgi:hypothetical protein